jgi:hypothetical protein
MYSNSQGTNWKGLDPIKGAAVGSTPVNRVKTNL